MIDRLTGLWFAPVRGGSGPPPEAGPDVEVASIPAEDGSALDAWWFPSRGHARSTVVLAHGNAENLGRHWPIAPVLARAGHDVLVFDYRGFGRSPGRATRRRAVADVHAALDWSARRGDGLPTVLLGQSMGGALALQAAAARDDVAALIVDSPFSSWSAIATHHLAPRFARAWIERALRAVLAAGGLDPVACAAHVRAPMLVVGGGSDVVCPPHMARAIAENAAARLVEIPDAPHVGSRTPGQAALVHAAMIEFLEEELPPVERASEQRESLVEG